MVEKALGNPCGVFLEAFRAFVPVGHVGRVAHIAQRLLREPLQKGLGDGQTANA